MKYRREEGSHSAEESVRRLLLGRLRGCRSPAACSSPVGGGSTVGSSCNSLLFSNFRTATLWLRSGTGSLPRKTNGASTTRCCSRRRYRPSGHRLRRRRLYSRSWCRRRWWRRSLRHLRQLRGRASAILPRLAGLAQMAALEQHSLIGLHLIGSVAHRLRYHDRRHVPRQRLHAGVALRRHANGNMHRSRARHQQPQIRCEQGVGFGAQGIVHLQIAAVQAEQQLTSALRRCNRTA